MLEFFEKPSVLILVVLLLVVFGSKRLPDSARSLGRSMRILKAEAKGLKDDEPSPAPVAPPTPISATPASAAAPVAPSIPVVPAPVAAAPVAPAPIGTPVVDQAEHRA